MPALDLEQFEQALCNGALPLDLRPPEQFAAQQIPGSLFLQFGSQDLGDRAELYLPKDQAYVLVMEPAALGPAAERLLTAAGYSVRGFLAGGLKTWREAGRPLSALPAVRVEDLRSLLDRGETVHLIDVREDFEYDWGHVEGAIHLPSTQVWQRGVELDPALHWHVICNDQQRSAAAASILRRLGLKRLTLVLGGTAAWMQAGFPLQKAQ